jgi:hypothetical protein
MDDDKISSALGIRPLAEISEEEKNLPAETVDVTPLPSVMSEDDDENIQDLETVRQNIQGIIETGNDAMREMLEIAKQSEQPRAFEVVSTLMKTMLDANKDFADVSTKKKFAKEEINAPKQAAQVTNNNLIVSTADLLKMIKGNNDG